MEVISSTANLQKIIGITAGKFKNVILHGQISDKSSNLYIRVGSKNSHHKWSRPLAAHFLLTNGTMVPDAK